MRFSVIVILRFWQYCDYTLVFSEKGCSCHVNVLLGTIVLLLHMWVHSSMKTTLSTWWHKAHRRACARSKCVKPCSFSFQVSEMDGMICSSVLTCCQAKLTWDLGNTAIRSYAHSLMSSPNSFTSAHLTAVIKF